jgi:PAS domain-containing protein
MKASLEGGAGDDDRWHVRKDGSRFWSGGVMTTLRDEDSNLRGFAKIMRDRTEWKLAEDERASLSAILTASVDNIYLLDKAGRYRYVIPGRKARRLDTLGAGSGLPCEKCRRPVSSNGRYH